MEDEHTLKKWLGQTDLTQYLKDKEVQVLLTSLKERITSLKEVRVFMYTHHHLSVSLYIGRADEVQVAHRLCNLLRSF